MDGSADHGGLECHIQDMRLEHGDKRGGPVVAESEVPWPHGSCRCMLGWPVAVMGLKGEARGLWGGILNSSHHRS